MHSEEQAVGQARQLVVMRQVVEVLLFLEELRLNLAPHADIVSGEGQDMPPGQLETLTPDFDAEDGAVFAHLADLKGDTRIGIPKFSQ